MLLTTGIIALGQKAAKEKAKRKEKQEQQGVLSVGDSDVAKRAFAAHTSRMIEDGSAGPSPPAEADVKFETPAEVHVIPPSANPALSGAELCDARRTSQLDFTSPVQSEKGVLSPGSAYTETPTTPMDSESRALQDRPPAYSSASSTTLTQTPTLQSTQNVPFQRTSSDVKSISSRSTNSRGTHAIRIKTRGSDLKSGFAYHPALFDLNVRPDQWDTFTSQIIETTKFSTGDHAKVWAAATGVALTGAIATGMFVGQSMNRAARERKIREGLEDMSDGGLGDKLRLWNEEYFSKHGIFVHLELSESSMKNDGRTKVFRKPALFYSKGEERNRKKDERKFVIVVTRLDEDGQPMEAVQELAGEVVLVEIGSSGGPYTTATELPAEVPVPVELAADMNRPVEMPGDNTFEDKKKGFETPGGVVEMSGDNMRLLEKLHIGDPTAQREPKDLNTSSSV